MLKRALIAAALTLGAASAAQAVTLVNGSFETGPVPNTPPGFTTLGTGDTSITGWEVTAGSIDYIGSYWTAQDGSRSIDLAGTSLGTLTQTLTDTVAGQRYAVNFWVSKNPDGGAATRTGTFSAGGQTFNFSYSAVNDRTNMNWQLETFEFFATGTNTDLSFAADASAGCCFGPALDNVSIAAVPEPATWAMMIGGFALVGGSLRVARRRKVQALAAA
jgi:choice-of-anchor C domain-containing protein